MGIFAQICLHVLTSTPGIHIFFVNRVSDIFRMVPTCQFRRYFWSYDFIFKLTVHSCHAMMSYPFILCYLAGHGIHYLTLWMPYIMRKNANDMELNLFLTYSLLWSKLINATRMCKISQGVYHCHWLSKLIKMHNNAFKN